MLAGALWRDRIDVSTALVGSGIDVRFGDRCADVIEALEAHDVDVVLVDTGDLEEEALGRLGDAARASDVPWVAVDTTGEDAERARACGAADVVDVAAAAGALRYILRAVLEHARRRQAEQHLQRLLDGEVDARIAAPQLRGLQTNLLDQVPQAIIATGTKMARLIYWNRGAEEMFGWSRDEALGRDFIELLVPEDRIERATEIASAVREGRPWNDEFEFRRKDGTRITTLATAAPITRADGEVVGTVGVATDITQTRETERRLRRSQKMEAIGQLAGGIAHDFNNLLTVIRIQTDLLLTEEMITPFAADVEVIQDASERAAQLTRQLLAFGREQDLHPRVVDLDDIVRSMSRIFRRTLGEHVTLVADLAPDLPAIKVDPGQMEQVLMNLTVNARDAMPEGGTLTISTRRATIDAPTQLPDDEVGPGEYVVLEVTDTGSGMDESTLERVFEPFFTTKGPQRGTGLGLATVYGIVTQSGGTIHVASTVGEGATFRLMFPAVDESSERLDLPGESTRQPAPMRAALDGLCIALVEDSEDVLRVATRVLTRAGHDVRPFDDAETAVEAIEDGLQPDLLITDLMLPRMRGPALVERARELVEELHILATSGYSEGAGGRSQLPSDVRFIPKPFTPGDLLDAVREATNGSDD